jgi:hypothetical protein
MSIFAKKKGQDFFLVQILPPEASAARAGRAIDRTCGAA